MCRVKITGQEEGLIPAEAVVRVQTADGHTEELVVSPSQIKDNSIQAALVGRDKSGRALVELPREAASGTRRVWVTNAQLV